MFHFPLEGDRIGSILQLLPVSYCFDVPLPSRRGQDWIHQSHWGQTALAFIDPILSPSRGKWNIKSMREELQWLLWIQSNPMGENHILFYWFDLTPSIGKSRLKFGSLAKILDCKGIPFEHFWGGSRPMRSLDSGLSTNHRPRFQAIFFPWIILGAATLFRFSQS